MRLSRDWGSGSCRAVFLLFGWRHDARDSVYLVFDDDVALRITVFDAEFAERIGPDEVAQFENGF